MLTAVLLLVTVTWPLGLLVDIQDTDEAIYAEIAREMVERDEFVDTPGNYQTWFVHPPMSMWALAGAYRIFGVSPWAGRVPAVIEALLIALMTWWLGRRLWSHDVGMLAAALFLACPATSLMVHNVKTDLNLILFVTATIVVAYEALERPSLWLVAGALAAGGLLSKGPVGLGWPAIVVFVAVAWERTQWRKMWRAWPYLAGGVVVCAVCYLPWILAMHRLHGPQFVDTQLLWSTFGRFSSGEHSDSTTPLYFLHTLLWAAAPAIPAVLAGLWQRGAWLRGRLRDPPMPILDVVCLLVPLVAMSMSKNKLPHYIFPVLPALCIVAAAAVARLDAGGRVLRAGAIAMTACGVLAGALHLTVLFPPAEGFGLHGLWLVAMAVSVVGCALVWRGDRAAYGWAPGISMIAAMALHNATARVQLDAYVPTRMIADVLRSDGAEGLGRTHILGFSDERRWSIPYATGARILTATPEMLDDEKRFSTRYVLGTLEDLDEVRRHGLRTRVRGTALSFPTSRLSIPFAMADRRDELATPVLLVEAWRRAGER